MSAKKDRIIYGDTYHVSYTCVEIDETSRQNERRPVYPVAAYYSMWNVINSVWVPLNEDGDTEIAVVPDGNKIDFIIPAEALIVDGDYSVFTTVIFNEGGREHKMTQKRSFRVLAKE